MDRKKRHNVISQGRPSFWVLLKSRIIYTKGVLKQSNRKGTLKRKHTSHGHMKQQPGNWRFCDF